MKTHILLCLIFALLCQCALSQTADDYVNQGLADLGTHDIVGANASFAQALSLDPNHENANALYAITRLLVLPYQPVGSNFLTRVGLPIAGRNIYAWSALPPKDENGLLLAPDGVDANEFTAQLRTNVLLAVSSAINNLSVITDTSFTINLTSSETAMADVTVDYGDLKMIQAGLYASEYFIYTLNAQNLDAQLTDIRALYTNGVLTASQVLADYPQLFTFATTNDLQAARVAFTNAVNCYMTASAFIRSRPPDEVRLFNYDKVSATNEADFRSVLTDLENSLASAQILSIKTNLTVNMASSFDGTTTYRSLLPQFQNNAIVLGSFPDLTFGDVIDGLTRGDVEGGLSKYLVMLPFGNAPSVFENTLQLSFNTLRGHYYALEASTNFVDWQVITNFTATNATTALVDSQSASLSKRFYRLRDDTGFMAFSGFVLDQNTSLPIVGAQVYSDWDGATTYTDANGQFYLRTTVPSSWDADQLSISAAGYGTVVNYYYGNGLVSGLQIYMSVPPPNDNFANRTVLTGSNVSTNGNNFAASYQIGDPSPVNFGKSVWFTWTAPTSGIYTFSLNSSSQYPTLAVFTGSQLSNLSLVNSGYFYESGSFEINVTGGQIYQIGIDDQWASYGGGGAYTLSIAP